MASEPQTKTDAITRAVRAAQAARAASVEAGRQVAADRAASQTGEPAAQGTSAGAQQG